MWGFESLKDLLEVVLVPVIGGTVALLWPELQAGAKRRRFERLIERELQELGPFPKERSPACRSWMEHQRKQFLHQHILEEPSSNLEFILTMDATVAYWVSQLWDALRAEDSKQWLWYLKCLSERYGGLVAEAYEQWSVLIESYNGGIA